MPKKGLFKGSKIAKSHSSVVSEAVPMIEAAKGLPQVSKVVPSEIVRVRGGEVRIKFMPVQAGLRMVVRGVQSQQEVFVYTGEPAVVERLLRGRWDAMHG